VNTQTDLTAQQSQPEPLPESLRLRLAPLASQVCEVLDVKHVLDYRCGAEPIARHLKVGHAMKVQLYEPKFERFALPPLPADLVFYCADDGIEDEMGVESLLRTLAALSGKACILAVPVVRVHYAVWLTQAMRFFEVQTFQKWQGGFFIVGYPLEEQVQLLS